MRQKIPLTIEIEHEELHEELARAIKAGGKTAEAARAVMKVLQPHMAREEEFVSPALALLAPLAAGQLPRNMASVIAKVEALKLELPDMLAEHRQIVDALRGLIQSSAEETRPSYAKFAHRLIAHALSEENILYPAAVLVGEYLKERARP